VGSSTSTLEPRAAKDPAVLWVTGFGVGYLKPAPGTWGSAAALAVWWFAIAEFSVAVQVGTVVGYTLLSWVLTSYVCRRYALDDAPQIVADEVAGMWLALLVLPMIWWVVLLAFGLFRLLDITKPWIIGWLDRQVPGGAGVMVDDVVAGIAVGFVLKLSLLSTGWT
jgi:phosphatidylglycerophosphatase A